MVAQVSAMDMAQYVEKLLIRSHTVPQEKLESTLPHLCTVAASPHAVTGWQTHWPVGVCAI